MAKDEKIDTFRIADLRRPEVRSYTKPTSTDPEPASVSAGFPAVEAKLEKGTIESVADELRGSYEQLEALSTGTNAKLKGPAKKAMAAYERTADLFEYLFATKSSIAK
ncbi:MAG: hypothetical protein U1E65_07450 [Myxococcota bacterium]